MSTLTHSVRMALRRRDPVANGAAVDPGPAYNELPPIDIAPDDPLLAYAVAAGGAIEVDALPLTSPALTELRAAGVELIVPLVAQGELIGLLNLGGRLSEREYSRDDKRLLEELATHAAPAIRVAQLVREQKAEAALRERMQQELRVAQLIQQQFLPGVLPVLPGWHVAAHYQPAREVGGDFYDFLELPGGLVGIVVGDVTDKGVPAALVMATTHSLLRAEAPRLVDPGAVLERINDLLVDEMPPHMFVTCLYAVLEPATGRLRIANAGHNLPYVATEQGSVELRARGLPLGLMAGMRYEETAAVLAPGDRMLLHSDGLAEAHDPGRRMFGFPRMRDLVGRSTGGQQLIDRLLAELRDFTGPGWVQEDDITLVTLERPGRRSFEFAGDAEQELTSFEVPSVPGNERLVRDRVAAAVAHLDMTERRLERLATAVTEAAMNAIEHGNHGDADLPVGIRVLASPSRLRVLVTDEGDDVTLAEAVTPDLDAKLAGEQPPRGWGLFLIQHMVDEMSTSHDGERHTIELVLRTAEEADHASP